jgi:hypothetical protein
VIPEWCSAALLRISGANPTQDFGKSRKEEQMNGLGARQTTPTFASAMFSILLAAAFAAAAQTSSPTKPATTAAKPVAKPPTGAVPTKPMEKTTTKPSPVPPAKTAQRPAATPSGVPATSAVAQPVTSSTQPASIQSTSVAATPPPPWSPLALAGGSSDGSASSGPPSVSTSSTGASVPAYASGLGTLTGWGGYWTGVTLTVYPCFRADNQRVFCDFDVSSPNNGTIGAGAYGVSVVDDGGKITGAHSAFFVAGDGSQMPNAYVSPGRPVRLVVEYDNISQNSISLVQGGNRIQNVPVTPANPNLPRGTIPARGGAAAQQGQASTAGVANALAQGQAAVQSASNTVDQVQATALGAVDKANQTIASVNDKKKKAKSIWEQIQSTVQH